jgi:hypothetical protein
VKQRIYTGVNRKVTSNGGQATEIPQKTHRSARCCGNTNNAPGNQPTRKKHAHAGEGGSTHPETTDPSSEASSLFIRGTKELAQKTACGTKTITTAVVMTTTTTVMNPTAVTTTVVVVMYRR